MESETFGRWLRDVFVTLVLLFAGIFVAGMVARAIAPESAIVYILAQLLAWVPAGLWLRRCGVLNFGTRAEFVAITVSVVAYGLVLDLVPPAGNFDRWILVATCFVLRPLVQWLVERSSLLAVRTPDAAE